MSEAVGKLTLPDAAPEPASLMLAAAEVLAAKLVTPPAGQVWAVGKSFGVKATPDGEAPTYLELTVRCFLREAAP